MTTKNVVSKDGDRMEPESRQPPPQQHPFSHLLFSEVKSPQVLIQHLTHVHRSLQMLNSLPQGCINEIRRRASSLQVKLPGSSRRRPTLFIDLDETLLHSGVRNDGRFTETVPAYGSTIYFNVRPYALEFLKKLRQHYQLVMYTASVSQYADVFYRWLNSQTDGAFTAYLSRDHCVELYSGVYVKDLSCITNRKASHMLLLDNTAYSFGSMIANGIPISSFTHDTSDQQLFYLQKYLMELAKEANPVAVNQKRLRLYELLQPVQVVTTTTTKLDKEKLKNEMEMQAS